MIDILVDHTKQTSEKITADIDRDYILRGTDAVAYGLVDDIIERRELAPVVAASVTSAAA